MASTPSPAGEITALIDRANRGDASAVGALFETLYGDLHALAHARLRHSAPFSVLDTTGLLHESYLKLVAGGRLNVANHAHFMAYASRTMRSIIVDAARQRLAGRRGGGAVKLPLDTDVAQAVGGGEDQIVRVHEALLDLEEADQRLAKVVEMRYFGGLDEGEIAQALGVTDRTVRRDWEKARLLLSLALRCRPTSTGMSGRGTASRIGRYETPRVAACDARTDRQAPFPDKLAVIRTGASL